EPSTTLFEPDQLPDIEDSQPLPPRDYDALVRATRWGASLPYLNTLGTADLSQPTHLRRIRPTVMAPFHGAIQPEDYQLLPLLHALQMPRVSLLIADDVGLGKTIEAGLILRELLHRRRIRRVLIVCPAPLRPQWRQEMHDKFSLDFDEVD